MAKKDSLDSLKLISLEYSELESFDAGLRDFDVVPSSNPDSPTISFDLWSELEEEATSFVFQELGPEKLLLAEQNSHDDSKCKKLKPAVIIIPEGYLNSTGCSISADSVSHYFLIFQTGHGRYVFQKLSFCLGINTLDRR